MFTRKHYKAIAEIISERTIVLGTAKGEIEKRTFVSDLAGYFQQDNPQFSQQKFLVACGVAKKVSGCCGFGDD